MGLFSTLTSSQEASATVRSSSTSSSSSSLTLPTVVQLYGGKSSPLKLLQGVASTKDACVCHIPSFAVLTYQAVPTVALQSAVLEHHKQVQARSGTATVTANASSNATTQKQKAILKRIEQAAPDLGVWNCKVQKAALLKTKTTTSVDSSDGTAPSASTSSSSSTPLLVDSLLQIPTVAKTFCFTIDLSNQSQVEPTITRLQEALVRYMIANGKEITQAVQAEADIVKDSNDGDGATEENVDSKNSMHTSACTTSLFQLRSVQFGLAELDEASAASMKSSTAPDVSDHQVKVALLICAQLGGSSTSGSGSDKAATDTPEGGAPSESSDYKHKQGQALLIYHLRKYAAALNANLCFVQAPPSSGSLFDESSTATPATATAATDSTGSTDPPALSYPQVGLVWRALAQGQQDISKDITSILEMEEPSNTSTAAAEQQEAKQEEPDAKEGKQRDEGAPSLVYGPGNSQSDLIETVLLRHAHYPGHWDASKESVWTIFPASQDSTTTTSSPTSTTATATAPAGDEGWLSEIRESIAGATASFQTPEPKKKDDNNDSKVQQTPDATTDFFKSLLTPGD